MNVEGELGSFPLPELGRPTGVFACRERGLAAIASTFGLLYWPARAIYGGHRLRHRVSLYGPQPDRRVAVFDRARYDINDIAIHPTRPLMAIATGRYDGGYSFEGELLLWNWEEDSCVSLLGDSREVTRCRFESDGSGLVILLRPRDEEEFEGDRDAFDTVLGCRIADLCEATGRGGDPRLAALEPSDPSDFGFDRGTLGKAEAKAIAAVTEWFSAGSLDLEPRHHVWDLAWLDPETIAVVHDRCHLEVWGRDGKRKARHGGEGHGVQILCVPGDPLVHILHFAEYREWDDIQVGSAPWSELITLSPGDHGLKDPWRLDRAYTFSQSRDGSVLARHVPDLMRDRPAASQDFLLSPAGEATPPLDLGHYDCVNHYLRIDGAEQLYFLQGQPKTSHAGKRLCRLDPGTGQWRPYWEVDDAGDRGRHRMNLTGCLAGEGAIVLAAEIHHSSPRTFEAAMTRHDLGSGRVAWSRPISALVTDMKPLAGGERIAYALSDGEIGLLDAAKGETLWRARAEVDGVATVVLSLAVSGDRLAAGTIDGRILIYSAKS